MDHCKVPKEEINLTEIKVEDHLIKTEPGYYQQSVIDNNIQVRGVKVESDFSSQTETPEKEFQCSQCSKIFAHRGNLVEH